MSRDIVPPMLWRFFVLVWLLFLYYPLLSLWVAHPAPFPLAITLAGVALFVALYLYLALPLPFGEDTPSSLTPRTHLLLVLAAFLAADIVLLTFLASLDWLWFFIFVSIALGVRLPLRPAAIAVAIIAVLTVVVGIGPFGWVYALRVALPVAVVGLGMIGVGWLVATIRELRGAREEIARLAVAEERLRFARDLHDLLGHSLSAITLKNEVARSLVPTHPDRAVQELADAIGLAREALREVRQAVSGYRQPTLAMELRGARALLDAAGITCTVEDSGGATGAAAEPSLAPATEAVLAWAVREGVTNVVRHSSAYHCAIAILRQADSVTIEVTDDGHGSGTGGGAASSALQREISVRGGTGAGLRGLAERAAQVHGRMESGPLRPTGFRLRVTVPILAPDTEDAEAETAEVGDGAAHCTEERVARG